MTSDILFAAPEDLHEQLTHGVAIKSEAELRLRRWNDAAAVVLAATRNDSGKTQEELAKLVGTSRNVIANIETGRKTIELREMIVISLALHLDPLKVLDRILRW